MKIDMKTEVKTFKDGFDEFIRYCTVRDFSHSTIDNYRDTVTQFNKFFPDKTPISEISKDTIEEYIFYLRQHSNMSNTSIGMRLKNLKALFNFFAKKEYMEMFEFPHIRYEKKVKEVYTDDELKLLLVKPKISTCKFTEYRNWVIVNYLLSTGNRRSTLVNVRISDIDFDNNMIKLEKTKNRRQQYIPMSVTLSNILKEYLKYRNGVKDGYLFCNAYSGQLDLQNLRSSLSRYHRERGVEKTSIHLYLVTPTRGTLSYSNRNDFSDFRRLAFQHFF